MANKIIAGVCIILLGILLYYIVKPFSGVNIQQLAGSYTRYEFPADIESPPYDSLFVFADNTYEHIFINIKGDTIKDSGKWEFDLFQDRLVFHDYFGNSLWEPRVEKKENQIRIYEAYEEGVYYYKTVK